MLILKHKNALVYVKIHLETFRPRCFLLSMIFIPQSKRSIFTLQFLKYEAFLFIYVGQEMFLV